MYRNENDNGTPSGDGSILVTGGSGLVGAELIKQLTEKGGKVTAIYNSTPLTFENENLTAIKCDILDTIALEEAMDGIIHVYHCAGMVSFSPKSRKRLFDINIHGTANVVNAALNANVKKFLHVSSVAAIGRMREGQNVTEEMKWTEETSNSIYAKSKYLGEMEVWRGISEGLNAVIVNPSLILGPGDWNKGSSGIFKSAYNEFQWYAEGVSGFVDVKDVVRVMIMLMNSEISNQRFILNSENISFRDIFYRIAECFNKKKPHKKVTPFLGSLVWKAEAIKSILTGKPPLVTRETARTAQARVYFDNTKILNALPEFRFTPINKTIKDTCATLLKINNLS